MCIRDRIVGFPVSFLVHPARLRRVTQAAGLGEKRDYIGAIRLTQQAEDKFGRLAKSYPQWRPNPVAYTHLDVYKRQNQHGGIAFGIQRRIHRYRNPYFKRRRRDREPDIGFYSVSYTPLDKT